jgi:alpha-L-arabinofuranosidase
MTGEQLLEPEIEFSCFWNTRWIDNDSLDNSVYDALDKEGSFNANGLGLMIWGNYLGDQMVKTTSTLHIRSFASYLPEDKRAYIYLLNKSDATGIVNLNISGFRTADIILAKELVGDGSDDVNPVWRDYQGSLTSKDLKKLKLSGTSITLLELQLE